MPIQLPPKENTLFKRILKCYEQKQYKNGLKFCKQILSNPKFAEHGETLAMKGLTLNYLGRKEEAYDYVRRGLRNDLKSHVCWHVFGLLLRSDHKYDEAIKCYRNALKWDKDNIQILRDVSLLQVQLRDTEGFRDTRYQLLKIRPAQRQSWIGYSISYYLLGDYEMAFQILEEFRRTLFQENQNKSTLDFEHSEMLLYLNMILEETNKDQECLEHLEKYEQYVTDKLKVQETKGMLNLKLGNVKMAETIYKDLIKKNPENCMYYFELEKCLAQLSGVEKLDDTERLAIYLKYRKRYPRSEAPKLIPLSFVKGSTFVQLVDEYLRNGLKRGIPPLFTNLQKLYADNLKIEAIEELVCGYERCLESNNKFAIDDDTTQDPTVLLWTWFYLAQHFDLLQKTELALSYINKVLEHTPTLIEGYMVKAKIYKHAGCPVEAARWMDEGRSLDTADRYVNSKCAKYLLRAGDIVEATDMCGLFTKEGTTPEEDLDAMQCMWFAVECAAAHQRRGSIGEALRKCHQIEKNFNEITEDQFDFHTYCMRKVTLCAYIRLLKLEDVLRGHNFYFKAARIAIECYLHLHDKPLSQANGDLDANKGNMSAEELKKLKSKQRRAKKKQQLAEDKKAANESKDNKESDGKKEEKKEKIDPIALAETKTPLEEAIKFLIPLQNLARNRLETHLMAFEIYSRKGKPLLMLQSMKRAYSCDKEDARVHECMVRFLSVVQKNKESYSDTVKMVLDKEIPLLVDEKDLVNYNSSYLEKHPSSLRAKIAVGKSMITLDPSKEQEALALITDLSPESSDRNLKLCSDVYKWLKDATLESGKSARDDYKIRCQQIFPHASIFAPTEAKRRGDVDPGDGKETAPDLVEEVEMNAVNS